MKLVFRVLVSVYLFAGLTIAAGFEAPEWDPYRLTDGQRTLMPLKVTTKEGLDLVGYSIGDQSRFKKHVCDMRTFFSDDRILGTWGGINAKTDAPKQFDGALERYALRAQNNLLSWRLYYRGEELISVAGSYLPIGNGSQYDGGAEIIANTHPDYWRHGVARAAVSSYVIADMMRSPFAFAWTTAKPENRASFSGVLGSGFARWEVNLEDPSLPSYMKRPGRLYFRLDRGSLEKAAVLPIEWIEK